MTDTPWTMGVEEEHQVIDATTRELAPQSEWLLPAAQQQLAEDVQPELMSSQVETASPICATLTDVRQTLTTSRRKLFELIANRNQRLGAAGTHPFSHWRDQEVTAKDRYQGLLQTYQYLAREQVIFGYHVHVGLDDQDAAVQVLNRARSWLSPLLALSASSPFWIGDDTGYSSFRTALWTRWPLSGPPLSFASRQEYDTLVQSLIAAGSIKNSSDLYWDVRLPDAYRTVEVRVADMCQTVDEAVMIAGLSRALVRTCYEQAQNNEPYVEVRPEVVRYAHWRVARHGLDNELADIHAERQVSAAEFIRTFVEFVRPALEAAGDWDEVAGQVEQVLEHGNGAQRQRIAYHKAKRWEEVVDLIIEDTARGVTTL